MGRASESSSCDPPLGQREGREERIIASEQCYARRPQCGGRGPAASRSGDVVDREIHEGPIDVLHSLNSAGQATILFRVVGSG